MFAKGLIVQSWPISSFYPYFRLFALLIKRLHNPIICHLNVFALTLVHTLILYVKWVAIIWKAFRIDITSDKIVLSFQRLENTFLSFSLIHFWSSNIMTYLQDAYKTKLITFAVYFSARESCSRLKLICNKFFMANHKLKLDSVCKKPK